MKELAKSSAEFIDKFASLANRLALVNVTTHEADLQWGSFGSWTIMVTKRNEALRVNYDGRDSILRVESSPVTIKSSYPNEWKEIYANGIRKDQDSVIAFTEDFICTHFGVRRKQ